MPQLIHTGTKQPLMGPEAEAMLREAADGVPARPRHGDSQVDLMTRTWLTRNGWIDDKGEPTAKATETLAAGSWPPAAKTEPAGFSRTP